MRLNRGHLFQQMNRKAVRRYPAVRGNGYQYFRDNSITEQDVFVNKPDTSCFFAEKINLHLKNIRRITYNIDSFIYLSRSSEIYHMMYSHMVELYASSFRMIS